MLCNLLFHDLSLEVEIIILDTIIIEAEFLKNFLYDFSLLNNHISQVSSKKINEKKRHLRVKHKSIRNLIFHGIIPLD